MSRWPVVIAIWVVGTALATSLAFVAISVVLHDVSSHDAERLHYGSMEVVQTQTAANSGRLPSSPTAPKRKDVARSHSANAEPTESGAGTSVPQTTVVSSGGERRGSSPDVSPAAHDDTAAHPSGPGDSSGSDGEGDGSDHGPPTTSSSASPANAAVRLRTFAASGNVVTATCTESTIRLVSSTPANGYTMTVTESGPTRVRVRFRASTSDVEVQAVCEDGTPTLDD